MIQESSVHTTTLSPAHVRLIRLANLLGGSTQAWPAELFLSLSDDHTALEQLAHLGLLDPQADAYYRLRPKLADHLDPLEDETQFERRVHTAALAWYVERLDGDPSKEAAYMAHFTQLCDLLLHQEPSALADLAKTSALANLQQASHRHLVAYYRALGSGLRNEIGGARQQLAELLSEPDLDDLVRGRALNSSAIFARQQGDYEQALAGYQASRAIWQRLGNGGREGLALLNQGILHYELQLYPEAEADLYQALSLLEAAGMQVYAGSAHNELGLLYRDQGRWDAAQEHFATCTQIWLEAGASDYVGFAKINQAEMALLHGRYAEAEELLQAALALLGEQTYAVEAHINLGLLAQAQGQHEAALQAYQRAQQLSERVGYHERAALILLRQGHAYAQLGQTQAASTAYAAAVEAVEQRRAPMRSEGLLISLMGRWQQAYEMQVLHALAQGDLETAFVTTERARARAFADMLMRRTTGTSEPDRADPLPDFELARLQEMLHDELLLSYFAIGLRGPEQSLLDRLPPEAAGLRACLAVPAQLIGFALTREHMSMYTCAIDPNLLHSSSPRKADGRRFLQPIILRQLYDTLVAPISELLSADRRLAIVPHGPLHHIPFAALCDAQGRPLIDQVGGVVTTPSATIWLHHLEYDQRKRQQTASTHPKLLALGFDGADGTLRHTEAEARTVAQVCAGEVWTGDGQVLERLLERANDYQWLHFACHGTFNLNEPLESALHIGPNQRLSAANVLARMSLQADLVTLSACRSGVSKVLRGDEPLGLVRAFLGAGAHAVLVTLWPVEDSSARLLMERFYHALLQESPQMDPAAALWKAQRALRSLAADDLLKEGQRWGIEIPSALDCSDPAIWAAYVLIEG
jgi:CHAT domain-containing protein/tetratricopeptide (TPR) repeat protein